ncbi:AMP-binding protein, partial [Klebsiella pneumoniae]|nr:AMP-binding protein [Klebsiella pneumoniae]
VKPFEANGLRNKMVGIERGISKFDITVNASESANGLILEVEYCTALFKKERIERLAEHLLNLLQKAAENPDIELNQIDVLKKAERNRILQGFNRTDGAFCKEKTIPQLFEEQAERTPEKTAVVYGGSSITYRRLNEKANQLARTLKKKGLAHGGAAAIMMERSLESAVSMLAVLKAGGAYVRIDPDYPEE